jgi:hypothetical protein
MSWRAGLHLFYDIWPRIKARIPDPAMRAEFTGKLLEVFAEFDMAIDEPELETDPDLRAAFRQAGYLDDEE